MTYRPAISKNFLEFLNQIKENNNREWFNERKDDFKKLESEAKDQYQKLFEILKTHDDVDHLKVFRIYRDVRFSKNKLPYKLHSGCSFRRRKPQLRGGYYVHVQPNNQTFIAVGFWDPFKEDLLRIRKEFETDADEIKTLMNEPNFKSIWGELEGEELKTAPKGFDKEHPAIDLIRKKQFIFRKKYTDAQVTSADFIEDVNKSYKAVRPFLDYMSSVLTTNINGESVI